MSRFGEGFFTRERRGKRRVRKSSGSGLQTNRCNCNHVVGIATKILYILLYRVYQDYSTTVVVVRLYEAPVYVDLRIGTYNNIMHIATAVI